MKQAARAIFVLVLTLSSARAFAVTDAAMTAGDLADICTGSSVEAKASCRFYILGVTQGVMMGLSIADTRVAQGRPCIPEDLSGPALEMAVKMKLGEDLMVFPADRALDASGMLGAILIHAFPCRQGN